MLRQVGGSIKVVCRICMLCNCPSCLIVLIGIPVAAAVVAALVHKLWVLYSSGGSQICLMGPQRSWQNLER